jgi:centromere protein S
MLTRYAPIEAITTDLLSFASHGGRSTINTDDVLLISRRNPALEELMRNFIENEKAKTASTSKGAAVRSKKGKGRA